MINQYTKVLDYATSKEHGVVGIVVPTYVEYLRCQNYLKLYSVLPESVAIVTYTGYKTMLRGNNYVCLVNTQSDYNLMAGYKFSKYIKGDKLANYIITSYDIGYLNQTVDINNVVNNSDIVLRTSKGVSNDENDQTVLTSGIWQFPRWILPLQLALAEGNIIKQVDNGKLNPNSLAYISCLGLNRLLPLLTLPDFINTRCYTSFEQCLFYFWRLVTGTRSAINAFTTSSVDAILVKTYHQNNDVLLFLPYFESSTKIQLKDIEIQAMISLSTISELAKEIAPYYWPYCYILKREGDSNFIEIGSGSSITVPDEVQQYDTLACLDIDWNTQTAKFTLPYYQQ